MSGYTRIQARVTDQAIQLVNVPLIASGGQNEVRVDFTFCSKWADKKKTAVFYQNPEDVYHVMMDDDSAVVPPEALAKEGLFYFGVFGADGEQIRTTEVVGMTVVKGAITFQPSDAAKPTPNIYHQLMTAYCDLVNPEGNSAVHRVKDQNGGADATLWVGTMEEYLNSGPVVPNRIHIITEGMQEPQDPEPERPLIVYDTFDDGGTVVRWYSGGNAEAWVSYHLTDVTLTNAREPLYLSKLITLAFPRAYTETTIYETPYFCEASIMGIDDDSSRAFLQFSAGSNDNYKSDMRIYLGALSPVEEPVNIRVTLHLMWVADMDKVDALKEDRK